MQCDKYLGLAMAMRTNDKMAHYRLDSYRANHRQAGDV